MINKEKCKEKDNLFNVKGMVNSFNNKKYMKKRVQE